MPNTIFPAAGGVAPKGTASNELLHLINSFDWGATAVGPIRSWPETIRSTLRVMLASHVPMVLLMGTTGVLVYNDAYAVFAGRRHPDILGKDVVIAWPEIAEFNLDILGRVLDGETLALKDQQMTLDRTGVFEDLWLDLDYSPVLDERGVPIAELVIVNETTKRVMAEKALARSEERLSMALGASGIVGVWDFKLDTGVLTADDRFANMYDLDPKAAATGLPIQTVLARVHQDDRPSIDAIIGMAKINTAPIRAEFRLVNANGAIRWVLVTGRVVVDGGGKPILQTGLAVDITEQKLVAEQLAHSEAKFRAIADSMPQMVWSTLPDGYHDYYNARWYEFTGVPAGSTDGEGWAGMFHPDDQDRAWQKWRHSLETGEPYQVEYRLRHHSGEYRWTLGRAMPIRDADGAIVRWFGTCTDINDAKKAAEEREIVAQELSHRIKNIFAVLNGIISLTARTQPEIKPLAETLRARIAALGVAHDFVRPRADIDNSGHSRTTLHGLVATLMRPYREQDEDRFAISGDDIVIDDLSVTPLALLFHELATNAAKYGALSRPGGNVWIAVNKGADVLTMEWKESVPGMSVSPPDRENFGSRLVALAVEAQLSGTLLRNWEHDGLRVTVTIPWRSLVRDTH